MQPRDAFRIAEQVAAALAAAHAAGALHGNIDLRNIMLTGPGLVRVVDFGTSLRNASPAGDVASLAKVLDQTLGGQQVPARASSILARMRASDRRQPHESAKDIAVDLAELNRTWSRPRNRSFAFAAATLVLIAAVIVARQLKSRSESRSLPQLAVLQTAGDSSDHESVDLASALGNEIAARLVALKRVTLVHLQPDSLGHLPSTSGLNVLQLAIQRREMGPSVSISLTDSKDNRVIWTERRTFERSGLRELGRDVVIGVLESLGRPATVDERRIIGESFPSSAEAYEEFLVGNQQLALRSPPSIEAALRHYRRASDLDSSFAGAFARQAYGYAVLVDWGWRPSKDLPQDMLSEGMSLAERATRLDSTSADAWLARAYILRHRDPRRFAGAIEAFEHAIALDPFNAEAFHQYGQTLMALGRLAEASASYRRSLDIEPRRATELVPLAAIYERTGKLSEGVSLLDTAVTAAPQVAYVRAMRSMFRSQAGDFAGAREDAMTALSMDSSYRIPALAALARALWLSHDSAGALNRVIEAERSISNPSAPDPTEAFWLAIAEVETQRPAKAVELLRTSEPRGAWLWFYFGAGDLREFRKRADVSALLAEMDPTISDR
jgi:tetratricopeptide (TPR) repeat protein